MKDNKDIQTFDSRIDAKNAKFWVLFGDAKFKALREKLINISKSKSEKIEDAKDKVVASLYIADKAQQLNEAMYHPSSVQTFMKNGQEMYKVNGKTFDNYAQSGDKFVYFNGMPTGVFDGFGKIFTNPPKGSEVITVSKDAADILSKHAAADNANVAARASAPRPWTEKFSGTMSEELFDSGMFDAIVAMIPGGTAAKTVLATKTLAKPVAKTALKKATTNVLKYGAAEAGISTGVIALDKANDAIEAWDIDQPNAENQQQTASTQQKKVTPEIAQDVDKDVSLMQKIAEMAGGVGNFMKSNAVTIGALAAITVALVVTKDTWLGYLKKMWPFKKNNESVVAKALFDVDGKECKMSFDVEGMTWKFKSSQIDKKELKLIAKQLEQSKFFSKVAQRVQEKLDVVYESLDLPNMISHLSQDKDMLKLIDNFKSKWPTARNKILEITI